MPDAPESFPEASAHMTSTQEKYRQEREKRLRCDTTHQYVDLDSAQMNQGQSTCIPSPNKRIKVIVPPKGIPEPPQHTPIVENRRYRILIIGAGFGGLLFATRVLQTWFCVPSEILFVDEAGGFGGTWYRNQYPGLVCDVESYIYMPLLEETGYKPTQKYVSGNELKEYAAFIAQNFHLASRARFETSVTSLTWDEERTLWKAETKTKSGTQPPIEASFVYMATGFLNIPKVPRVIAEGDFQGRLFHASCWDYMYTGGTSMSPKMTNLKDKKVGVIGTGATAVQVIPELAKWAEKVYVFQRTPSAVAPRNNRPTTDTWWKEVIVKEGHGWQRRRRENFNVFLSNDFPLPTINHVSDEWSKFPSYSCLVGGRNNLKPGYFSHFQELDVIRMDHLRSHVDEVVADEKTRAELKPWYYGWCKRPCFSDEYLKTFNQPNVTLVDTNGKGVGSLTRDGIFTGSQQYKLDAIVLCTGYQLGGSFHYGRMLITGRNGVSLQKKWQDGVSTLHGVMTNGFPNLFFPGPYQAGATGNQMFILDQLAQHVAAIVTATDRKRYEIPSMPAFSRVSVEPTVDAETSWTMEVVARAGALKAMRHCTPSYFNSEGAVLASIDEQLLAAKGGIWGSGANDFAQTIQAWRDDTYAFVQDLEIRFRQ